MKQSIVCLASALLAVSVTAGGVLAPATAEAREPGDYAVRDLLEPCVEGDNDSRGGAVLELECEQYINGFTDAYVKLGGPGPDGVCLPTQNQADEIRWAFMRWAHANYGERDIPAVDGILRTVKAHFACP